MQQVESITESVSQIQKGIYLLKLNAPEIASVSYPGQFCNIQVQESNFPLLRRPFSICDVEGDKISFMFNIVGQGTEILSKKNKGDTVNIIGPLGKGFNFDGPYHYAFIVAGGIGSAPFPFLINRVKDDKKIVCFSGGRTKDDIISYGMKNVLTSSDDGSYGFHGNVVQLLESKINDYNKAEVKIFACGPNPMLRALSEFSIQHGIDCEISTESAMACGFGICQGCPIESRDDSFVLVCKDGPVFNAKDVML